MRSDAVHQLYNSRALLPGPRNPTAYEYQNFILAPNSLGIVNAF